MNEPYDVIIVGSGAGGAAVAWRLVNSGRRVLLVEKGTSLPLGLKQDILRDEEEAKHFDGYASPSGYKSDAECNLLDPPKGSPRLTLMTGKAVACAPDNPLLITGVCR